MRLKDPPRLYKRGCTSPNFNMIIHIYNYIIHSQARQLSGCSVVSAVYGCVNVNVNVQHPQHQSHPLKERQMLRQLCPILSLYIIQCCWGSLPLVSKLHHSAHLMCDRLASNDNSRAFAVIYLTLTFARARCSGVVSLLTAVFSRF